MEENIFFYQNNNKIIKILLFILFNNLLLSFNNKVKFKNKDDLKAKDNPRLYDYFKNPKLSILIPNIYKLNLKEKDLLRLLKNLSNQTIKNIEIIISISKSTHTEINNIIKNYSLIDKKIKLISKFKRNIMSNIIYLTNILNGKYIIVIDKINKFINFNLKNNEFEIFYNFTSGKINNIYKFNTSSGYILYLIKSKILKDIIDEGLNFKTFKNLINYIFKIKIPNLYYIPVAYCINNHYTPLTYTSMISVLYSKNIYTYIEFYIIVPKNFRQKNIDFLKSLYEEYDYFNITFIKMDDRYDKAFVSRYITNQAYYIFSLGELIPYLNKIIYLDSDTIVFNDLNNFYNINFNKKIILGQVTTNNKNKKSGKYTINTGVLFFNLNEMRKIKMEKRVLNIINHGFKSKYHDQGLIKIYFDQYVSIFPPKFHSRLFSNYSDIIRINKLFGSIYNNDYLYFSWKYPTIRHYLGRSKPTYSNDSNTDDWWYFARTSKYFKQKTNDLKNIFNFTY